MNATLMIRDLARKFDQQDEYAGNLLNWTPVYYYLERFHGHTPRQLPSVEWVLWYTSLLMEYLNGFEVRSKEFMDFMDSFDNTSHFECPVCGEFHVEGTEHKDWNDDSHQIALDMIAHYKEIHTAARIAREAALDEDY